MKCSLRCSFVTLITSQIFLLDFELIGSMSGASASSGSKPSRLMVPGSLTKRQRLWQCNLGSTANYEYVISRYLPGMGIYFLNNEFGESRLELQ